MSLCRVYECARACVRIIRVLFGGSSRLASTSPRLSLTSPPSLPRPWRYPPSHRSHRLHSPSSRSLRSSLSRLSPPLPRSLAPCPDSVASPNPRCQSVSHRSRSIAVSVARPRTWPETSRSHRPRRSSRASRSDDDDASAFPQSITNHSHIHVRCNQSQSPARGTHGAIASVVIVAFVTLLHDSIRTCDQYTRLKMTNTRSNRHDCHRDARSTSTRLAVGARMDYWMRARSIAERRAPQTTTTEATSARASERIDPTRARVSDRSVRRGEASEERTREGIESRIDRSERRSTTRDVRFARVERWRSR